MIRTTGIVHGNTIEIAGTLGLPDGQAVELVVQVPTVVRLSRMEQRQREIGFVWTEKDDQILEEIARDRDAGTFRELPE